MICNLSWASLTKLLSEYRGLSWWSNPLNKEDGLINKPYYMASLASGEDERNRALWLATRAALSGLPAVSRKQNFPKSHIINPLLTRFVRSRWLDIGLVLFLRVYGPRFVSVHKRAKKRTSPTSSHLDLTLGQWPKHICSPLVHMTGLTRFHRYDFRINGYMSIFTRV